MEFSEHIELIEYFAPKRRPRVIKRKIEKVDYEKSKLEVCG